MLAGRKVVVRGAVEPGEGLTSIRARSLEWVSFSFGVK
jgi:hypothetical protein